jgi:hypothetical protein
MDKEKLKAQIAILEGFSYTIRFWQ